MSFELTRSGFFTINKAEAKIDELYYVEEKEKVQKPKLNIKNITLNATNSTDSTNN